jgi:tetratricopeptide (TPR) repeat protein
MSRFNNLEFEGEPEQLSPGLEEVRRDEAHYYAQAETAFHNGEFEPALRWYSKTLEYNTQNTAAWAGQVRMLIELNQLREARLWAEKALERFPREAELLAAKAVALARSGAIQEAMACSDASLEQTGESGYLWLARGDVFLSHDEQRADYCFEKAMLIAPHDWVMAWLTSRIRFYHRQFAQALKASQKALEWNACHFLLWLELGRCQMALGLTPSARGSLEKARELNPRSEEVALALATLSNTSVGARVAAMCRRLFTS